MFYLFDSIIIQETSTSKNSFKKSIVLIRQDAIGDFIIWLDTAKEYRNLYPPNEYRIIKDEGMPIKSHVSLHGILIINLIIDFPSELHKKQIDILKKILPNTIKNAISNYRGRGRDC